MSLAEIQNVVLLFSNPVWSGSYTVPPTIIRNLTALSSQIAYESIFDANLTTLSTNDASTTDGILQGLLYVPGLNSDHPCATSQYEDPVYLPKNVTKKANLPPANYKLIAIAPWYNDSCTLAYLDAVRYDPIQGFIFYRPRKDVDYNPLKSSQDASLWRPAKAGKNWAKKYRFPIYGVSRESGGAMVTALSKYSGTIDTVPYSDNITTLFGPNNDDYVRIWTQMRVTDDHHGPSLGEFFVIVIASLIAVISGVSCIMHLIQRSRRKQLEHRVRSGEVDLEAMGIARVSVPLEHIKSEFPLFTYYYDPETMTPPSTPLSTCISARARRLSRPDRAISEGVSASGGAGTTPQSGSVSESNYTAVGTNHQPQCKVCDVAFENRVSVIRQLPCFHIFHAECIEEYLNYISCMCPLCRQSMLPDGHCPRISNTMVYKERRLHRLRGHVMFDDNESKNSQVLSIRQVWKHFALRVSDTITLGNLRKASVATTTTLREKSSPAKVPQLTTVISTPPNPPLESKHVSVVNQTREHTQWQSQSFKQPLVSGAHNDTIHEGVAVGPQIVAVFSMPNEPTATATNAANSGHDAPAHVTKTTGILPLPSSGSADPLSADDPLRNHQVAGKRTTQTKGVVRPDTTTVANTAPTVPIPVTESTTPVRMKGRWLTKKGIVLRPIPLLVSSTSPVDVDTQTKVAGAGAGEGRRSPGTIRRLQVRQYAQRLAEEETWVHKNRPLWRRATTKMFPTLG